MWSIGGKILDVYDDVGLGLLADSPYMEKVGSLPLGDPAKLAELEDRHFGVIFITKTGEAIRKYPLNDMTNVVLSNVYFDLNHSKLPPEAKVAAATRIKKASSLHGITSPEAVEKYAAEDAPEGHNYVYLTKVQAQHPRTIDFFKQLHDEYVENREKYARDEKIKLAQAMASIADKYGLEVHDDLKPFVVKDPVLDKEAFQAQCAHRRQILHGSREEAGPLLDELMSKQASFDPQETVKLLETFDRQFGLEQYWTRGLEPNLVLMEKQAYHSIPIRGRDIDFSETEIKSWVAANGDLLEQMFGKEGAEKLKSDPMSVWSLPGASRDFIAARIEHARDNTPASAS